MRKINAVMFIFAFLSILFITVSYAAFNTNLYVSGRGVLRAHADTRVVGIRNTGYHGDAIENFNPNYNVDITNMSVDLPSTGDYMIYEVTIKNYGDKVYLPQIEVLSEVSNNVVISITDGTTSYNLPNNNMNYSFDSNEEKTYTITIANKPNTTNEDVVVSLKYHFVVDEMTAPIIALDNNGDNVELALVGTSTFGVDHYEYYVSRVNTTPASDVIATGNTNGTLSVSSVSKTEYPEYYIWYRTVSTKGTKSEWSNAENASQKFVITFNYNDGVTSNTTRTITYGEAYGTLPEPEREGYTFLGWEGNILDVYDLNEKVKSYGIAINSNGYVYDQTPDTDTRDGGYNGYGYRHFNWYIDLTPRKYTYIVDMIEQATIIENDDTTYVWKTYPTTTITKGSGSANVMLSQINLLNSAGISKTFFTDTNINAGILLKVYDGVADVKLNTILLSTDLYKLRVNTTLTAKWKQTKYEHPGDYVCNGTSNYIDTDMYLFNNENWQKNFYMKFEIKSDTSTDTMATAMSSKKEYQSPYPGLEFRHQGSASIYRSKAAASGSNTNDVTNIPVPTRYIKYLRINNILYYSFDNAPWTQMLDFTGFSLQFDIPVTFCAALNENSSPYRPFIGTLSDILIEFIDSDATLNDYIYTTLTLDNKSATTPGTTSINVTSGGSMPSITLPTKTGYIFQGYYSAENGKGIRCYDANGVGNSACTSLPNGTIYARWAPNTLYGVLENEYAINSGYVKLYSGSHQDALDSSGTNNIYYWYANNDANGNTINNDLRNVILGDHCWQMIRTTDTGGVKLLYNGVAENNQCLTTRGTHEGYNGNKSSQKLSTASYFYGTDYTYDSSTNKFTLSGTVEDAVWGSSTYQGLIGKYTCISTSASDTCSTLYLIESFNSNTNANCIPLTGGQQYNMFGKVEYNSSNGSLANLGYMYNTGYYVGAYSLTDEIINTRNVTTSNNFYYGDKIVKSGNYYYIENTDGTTPTRIQWTNSSADAALVGKYSCYNNNTGNVTNYNGVTVPSGTRCTTAYYILDATTTTNTIYHQKLINDITVGTTDVTLSTGYVDNQDGTYSLDTSGLTTISRMSYYTNFATYKTYYYCKDYVSTTCAKENMRYISNTNKNTISYRGEYLYGSSFEYVNGNYVLQNTVSLFTDNLTASNLNNHHYTCFNTTGECPTIGFIYYLIDVNSIKYISITGGNDIDYAVNQMLYNNDVNAKSSTIKFAAEAWYKKYMLSYQNLLEDSVFCYSRTQLNNPGNPYNKTVNGWHVNGSVTQDFDVGDNMTGKTLTCSNITDKFNTQNTYAQTNYPVGLLNDYETYLLSGASYNSVLRSYNYTNVSTYWIGSARHFGNSVANAWYVTSNGSMNGINVKSALGLRVVISTNPQAKIISGDGSTTTPYRIALPN